MVSPGVLQVPTIVLRPWNRVHHRLHHFYCGHWPILFRWGRGYPHYTLCVRLPSTSDLLLRGGPVWVLGSEPGVGEVQRQRHLWKLEREKRVL